MKNLFGSLIGILAVVFIGCVVLFHLWTTYIGFTEGGFFKGILTLFLPVASEIYWMYQMWSENDLYVTLGIISFIGLIIFQIADSLNG